MQEEKPQQPLWTYDFTVITIGSVISMVGGSMTNFAMSIMVLEYTNSTFLYGLFYACVQLPMLVFPLLAGPYLDRMSRKKVIYRLDFLSSGLYLLLFLLLRRGWSSYPLLLGFGMLTAAINSVYMVAYDSFYPNLITEGNLTKAYSVSSVLWPLASMCQPLAAIVYNWLGDASPLLAADAVCFFTAACFERSIRHQETHMADAPPIDDVSVVRRFSRDFGEGLRYIAGERGLLVIMAYFMVSNCVGAGGETLYLPFFRNHPELFAAWPVSSVTLFTLVSNFWVIGQVVGGMAQYRVRFPVEKKYSIAFVVYIAVSVLSGIMLCLPIPLMAAAFFLYGMLGTTSYNIRISATQSYIPDTKRARFNSTFNVMCSVGSMTGALLAGSLAEAISERRAALLLGALNMLAVWLFMYRGQKDVSFIYNRET